MNSVHTKYALIIVAVTSALAFFCTGGADFAFAAQDALPDAGSVQTDQPPEILSKDMLAGEAEYKAARQKLTGKQQKVLEDMETAYLLTLAPEMEIARLGLQLKSCKFNDDEKAEAGSIFSAFKLEKKNEQEKQLAEIAGKYKKKADFIDSEILTRHMATVVYFGKQVSLDALKTQMEQLKKTDAAALCDEGNATLKAFAG